MIFGRSVYLLIKYNRKLKEIRLFIECSLQLLKFCLNWIFNEGIILTIHPVIIQCTLSCQEIISNFIGKNNIHFDYSIQFTIVVQRSCTTFYSVFVFRNFRREIETWRQNNFIIRLIKDKLNSIAVVGDNAFVENIRIIPYGADSWSLKLTERQLLVVLEKRIHQS